MKSIQQRSRGHARTGGGRQHSWRCLRSAMWSSDGTVRGRFGKVQPGFVASKNRSNISGLASRGMRESFVSFNGRSSKKHAIPDLARSVFELGGRCQRAIGGIYTVCTLLQVAKTCSQWKDVPTGVSDGVSPANFSTFTLLHS